MPSVYAASINLRTNMPRNDKITTDRNKNEKKKTNECLSLEVIANISKELHKEFSGGFSGDCVIPLRTYILF